jgi:hypothetical protein
MRLDYELFPVHTSPKFLGTYERELHRVIERAIWRRPKYVLNIGCAEGFYAVGLAIRLNDAQVLRCRRRPKRAFRHGQECRTERRGGPGVPHRYRPSASAR